MAFPSEMLEGNGTRSVEVSEGQCQRGNNEPLALSTSSVPWAGWSAWPCPDYWTTRDRRPKHGEQPWESSSCCATVPAWLFTLWLVPWWRMGISQGMTSMHSHITHNLRSILQAPTFVLDLSSNISISPFCVLVCYNKRGGGCLLWGALKVQTIFLVFLNV